ncbi:iron-containing alcohol dehydrogenase [Saccharopolyspora sp. NPDC002376]
MPELEIALEDVGVPRQPSRDDVGEQCPALAKFHAPEIVFGPDSLAELGHSARRLGARRPFLVTDPGIVAAGWVREAVAHLREVGLEPVVWHELTPNPKDHEVQAAYCEYAQAGADVIIAAGGGSCIDAAKGVAIVSANGGAFTNAILGATHAMSHQVGGLLDAPHGVINGVLLPHVIRFNAELSPTRYVPLAAAAGIDTDRVPAAEVAEVLADRVRELADSVGVPRGLSCLGVGEHNVAHLARTTMKDACLATNPRQVTQAEIESLFRKAM